MKTVERPLTWSVVIPTYNAGKFLKETLESVLACHYPEQEMEIWVVDNCSTDNTKQIVESVGKGKINWYQHERNIGMMPNFNACVNKASGKYVHVLNADDTVKPDFYTSFDRVFEQYPDVGMACCDVELIDELSATKGMVPSIEGMGTPTKDVSSMMYVNPFRTPGVVVKKEAYKRLGGFDETLIQTADWEMWVRVIHNLGGVCINKVLCCYRDYVTNSSAAFTMSGKSLLEQEMLYHNFEAAGYPIDRQLYTNSLRQRARNEYIYFFLTDRKAFGNIKPVYNRLFPEMNVTKQKIMLLYYQAKHQLKLFMINRLKLKVR